MIPGVPGSINGVDGASDPAAGNDQLDGARELQSEAVGLIGCTFELLLAAMGGLLLIGLLLIPSFTVAEPAADDLPVVVSAGIPIGVCGVPALELEFAVAGVETDISGELISASTLPGCLLLLPGTLPVTAVPGGLIGTLPSSNSGLLYR